MPGINHERLVNAGFTVHQAFPGGRWFDVTDPTGAPGAVLCQSGSAWHFFYRDFIGTASDSSPERCHRGGLGDAIGTDSQMRTYRKLLGETPIPKPIRDYGSVRAAVSQAY